MKINLIAIAIVVLMQSCKDDKVAPDESEVFKAKISHTWKTNRVTHNDIDVTNDFKTLTIAFRADNTYAVMNAATPWPASGTYDLVNTAANQFDLKRNDGVIIEVTSLTDTSVVLELLYTSLNGRVREVSGRYRFEMTR